MGIHCPINLGQQSDIGGCVAPCEGMLGGAILLAQSLAMQPT